jgi:hypothetical protein
MRRTPWQAIPVALVLGLALAACDGPSRGSNTQPSSAQGFNLILTASPNVIRAAAVGSEEEQGGCAVVQAKVYDTHGNLVDNALVVLTTTLGRFPSTTAGGEEFVAVQGSTRRGIFTFPLCAKDERGTAIVTGTVEDAHATVLITIF